MKLQLNIVMIATVTINPAIDKVYYIDDFCLKKLHRITAEKNEITSVGGKGVNISVMLKNLDTHSIAMGFTGGFLGKKLEQKLRELGITTNFIRTEEETRNDIFIIDNQNDTITEINESGRHISEEDMFLFMDRYKKVLNQVNIMILAGSLLPLMDLNFYGTLTRLAKHKNVKTIVHTRPKYIDAGLKEKGTIVFPDMRSTCEFRGRTLDNVDHCLESGKAILDRHQETEVVIFAHLIKNIVAITHKKAYVFSSKELHPANLLGFNDAIVSGLTYGLEKKKNLKDALSLGCSAGFITIETNEKFCLEPKKIEAYLPRLETKEIAL
ncbi:1-phosphofructokinase family hexose kinase [Candidatus Margulisiibacteriota bacterium]